MTGIIFGAFDFLHAGHVHLLKQCRLNCDYLIVGLHVNPHTERDSKNSPIETLLERQIKLLGCKYVDEVIVYEKEDDIADIIKYKNVRVRFLGSDYKGTYKPVTVPSLVEIKYIDSLSVTSTQIRERIKNS